MTNRIAAAATAILTIGLIAGCTTAPEFAPPHTDQLAEAAPSTGDAVEIDVDWRGLLASAEEYAEKLADSIPEGEAPAQSTSATVDSAWNGVTYDADAARAALPGLRVAPDASMSGYDREALFGGWGSSNLGAGCDTRDAILQRDALSATVSYGCRVSGQWLDPYTGQTFTDASDLDIDHMVPLAEAYRSGAAEWTQAERVAYANSPLVTLAVEDEANQVKGDRGPESWMPGNRASHCAYAARWVEIKATYALTVVSPEAAALQGMLDTCP